MGNAVAGSKLAMREAFVGMKLSGYAARNAYGTACPLYALRRTVRYTSLTETLSALSIYLSVGAHAHINKTKFTKHATIVYSNA